MASIIVILMIRLIKPVQAQQLLFVLFITVHASMAIHQPACYGLVGESMKEPFIAELQVDNRLTALLV